MSVPLLGRFATAALQAALHRAVSRVTPDVMTRRARQVLTADALQAVSRLTVPILVLRATRDRVVRASAATEVARRAGRCTIVDIEAPHMLLQCAPAAAARAIVDVFEEQVEGHPHA
jgi:pimeloyl-ACP methyl ester carboxylesterase